MSNYRFNSYDYGYAQADRNRDGVLDRNEFRNYIDFANADRNNDGRVGLAEFATIAAPNLDIRPRNTAQAFMNADRNHDGVLDRRELADFSDFQHADLNQDGRVDPYEMSLFTNTTRLNNGPPQYYGPPHRRHHLPHRY